MRYELEMLEKILYYDAEGVSTRFPLYVYRTKKGRANRPCEKRVFRGRGEFLRKGTAGSCQPERR